MYSHVSKYFVLFSFLSVAILVSFGMFFMFVGFVVVVGLLGLVGWFLSFVFGLVLQISNAFLLNGAT